MSKKIKRIELLSKLEKDALYARPIFNDLERHYYFILNEQEQSLLKNYAKDKTGLYLILQMGYFKAKQQFFSFTLQEVIEDAHFVNERYFSKKINNMKGTLSRKYLKLQKNDILKFYEYKPFLGNEKKINEHLGELLQIYPNPHNALRQLLVYFEQQQIIVPGYRKLQDLFTDAYRSEKNRLNALLGTLPKKIQKKLNKLIKNDTGITDLNIIRADQKNFQYTAIKLEAEKANMIAELYQYTQIFIPTLGLSNNAVRYYADLTEQYPASRLRRLKKPQPWLYMMCFLHHRYQQLMDNLITSFSYHVRSMKEKEEIHTELALKEHVAKIIGEFPKLAKFLKWFPKQKNKPNVVFAKLSKKAYKILPEKQFAPLAEFIAGTDFDKKAAKWNFFAKASRTIALYLRPVLLSVNFEYYMKEHPILNLINVLKNHYRSGKPPSALKLSPSELKIPKSMWPYLKSNPEDEYLDPHRFEFFVYEKMYHHINRGRLFCNDSVSYADLDVDLVPDEMVDNVEAIAKKYGHEKIPIYCGEHLDNKLDELDAAWERTSASMNIGNNEGIKWKQTTDGKLDWHLLYDAEDELDEQFLSHAPKVEIVNMLKFVGGKIGLWNKFLHAKGRYSKNKNPDPNILIAGILAEAFGLSIEKIAEMSDLNYNTLRSTHEDFFSIITMCEANNVVADYIYSLPIFKLWNLIEGKSLGDADGQKISSTNNTLQSRYSKKFLGKDKGISIYTLLINFVAVNAKNIGPNEYEGHFLYDMVYGNKTEIIANMVTGDQHSLNKYNFVFLDSIDVDYVPSIKNIREAADDLYSVKPIENYKGILKPKGKIDQERIRAEKRGILRVLISLLVQENTQATIIRKLNSHARYVSLKAGLLEYNRILKSTHVLNLIYDMQLRKAIKACRNRTELYHSLQGVIRKVYHGIFKGKKITDNRLSAHATRLIANCIIAYNAILLNMIYEKLLEQGVSPTVLKEFARIAPIAWGHLIFTGKYNFMKNNGEIDIALVIETLEKFWEKFLKK